MTKFTKSHEGKVRQNPRESAVKEGGFVKSGENFLPEVCKSGYFLREVCDFILDGYAFEFE